MWSEKRQFYFVFKIHQYARCSLSSVKAVVTWQNPFPYSVHLLQTHCLSIPSLYSLSLFLLSFLIFLRLFFTPFSPLLLLFLFVFLFQRNSNLKINNKSSPFRSFRSISSRFLMNVIWIHGVMVFVWYPDAFIWLLSFVSCKANNTYYYMYMSALPSDK